LAKKTQSPTEERIQPGLWEQDGNFLKLSKPVSLIAKKAFTRT